MKKETILILFEIFLIEIYNQKYLQYKSSCYFLGSKYIEIERKYTSTNVQGWIADSDIPNTLIYKANQQWVQKLINEGYEVIDMGFPLDQNLGQSLFYNMELSTLFL